MTTPLAIALLLTLGVEQIDYTKMAGRGDGLLNVRRDGKEGFIDLSGRVVIPLQFDFAGWFSEGLARVRQDVHWGFIDRTGKTVIPFRFDFAEWFQEGFASVRVGELWGFIRPDESYLVRPRFVQVDRFHNGLAGVKVGERWGFIDRTGALVIPPQFDSAGRFDGFREGEAHVYLNSRSVVINREGKVLRDNFPQPPRRPPLGFEAVGGLSEGLAPALSGGRWGFVDESGEVVIAPQFEDANAKLSAHAPRSGPGIGQFSEGLAAVYIGGGWQFIDRTGRVAIPGPFRKVGNQGFHDGVVDVCGLETCGYIDKTGRTIWPWK